MVRKSGLSAPCGKNFSALICHILKNLYDLKLLFIILPLKCLSCYELLICMSLSAEYFKFKLVYQFFYWSFAEFFGTQNDFRWRDERKFYRRSTEGDSFGGWKSQRRFIARKIKKTVWKRIHCYRSSATALADARVGITNLKHHGGWQSTKVTEGYLNESLENKKLIASKILKSTPASASTSSCVALSYSHPATSTQHEQTDGLQDSEKELQPTEISIIPAPQSLLENRKQLASAINLSSASNCTFTINYNINK